MIVGNLVWTANIDTRPLRKDAQKAQGILSRLNSAVSKLGAVGLTALGAGALSAASAIREVIKVNAEFEAAVSDLSALTGLTGKDLQYLAEQAKRLGRETTMSATQVAQAMKLVGSQRPELLHNEQALTAVTEASIKLAEASGMELTSASRAVTQVLNMYNMSADKAAQVTDILAVAAQKGAGDIQYLSAAFEKVGGVAKQANVDAQMLAATFEMLAPAISEPTTAGLQLKNVLIRLQAAGLGMQSGTFNFVDALKEAKAQFEAIKDPAERTVFLTQLFGREQLVAATKLLDSVDVLQQFAAGLNESGAAAKMAATRTDNLQGAWARFKSALEGLILDLNSDGGLTNALKQVLDFLAELLNNFKYVKVAFSEVGSAFKELFDALSEIAHELGITNAKADSAATIMKLMGESVRLALLPLKSAIQVFATVLHILAELIEKIKEFVNRNEAVKQVILKIEAAIKRFISSVSNYVSKIAKFLGIDFNIKVDENQVKEVEATVKQTVETANKTAKQNPVKIKLQVDKKDLFELERMKIEAMQAGQAKELAMIDLQMRQKAEEYKKAGLAYLIPAVEALYEQKKQQVIKKYQEQELQKQREYQQLLISAMQTGLEKRLKLIDFEYSQRIEKLKEQNIDTSNVEAEWQQKRLEETKKYYKELAETKLQALSKEQQLQLLRAKLHGDSERQILILEKQFAIERLKLRLQTEKTLSDIDKKIINTQIATLEKELDKLQKQMPEFERLMDAIGKSIAENADWAAKSERDFALSVYEATRSAVASYIQRAVASAIAKALESAPAGLGLLLAPIAGAMAKAIFERLIPPAQPPRFAEGGVVQGRYQYTDRQLVLAQANEVILNSRQQANLLYSLSKQRLDAVQTAMKVDEVSKKLDDVVQVLKNQKLAVVKDNHIIVLDAQQAQTQKLII